MNGATDIVKNKDFQSSSHLNKFLWKVVIQPLQQKGAHARARASCNGMTQHKPFEGITTICFAVNHFHHMIFVFRTLPKSGCPVISRTSSFLRHEEILLIEQVAICAGLNAVNHAWFEINHQVSRNEMIIICLVEEHVFSIVSIARIFL